MIFYGGTYIEKGPAIIWEGNEGWYKNGKQHRLDGPAVFWKDGSKEYWTSGKYINTEEVEALIKENNIKLKNKKHQMLFKLRF